MVEKTTAIDLKIVEHVYRYGLSLPEAAATLCGEAFANAAEAEQTLDRLSGEGDMVDKSSAFPAATLLQKGLLQEGFSNQCYYYLSEAGAKALGQDPCIAKMPKKRERIERFAVLSFFHHSNHAHVQPFTRDEFRKHFSDLWYKGQPTGYYVHDDGQKKRLAYLRVDAGKAGQWDRLIDSCRRFVEARTEPNRKSPENKSSAVAFRKLLKADEFQITVLTAHKSKVQRIDETLLRLKDESKSPPPIAAYVVEGLFDLAFPDITKLAPE